MPEIRALLKTCAASSSTLPMCSFGAPWQKHTTVAFSPGFDVWLKPLNQLKCEHSSHAQPAGDRDARGEWLSGRAAKSRAAAAAEQQQQQQPGAATAAATAVHVLVQ